MNTYELHDLTYDALMAVGDSSKAQQSRLAIALYNMVVTSDQETLAHDMTVYRRNALRGKAYLEKHNLPAFPDSKEIADLIAWREGY